MDQSSKSNPVQKYFARPSRERLSEAVQAVLDSGAIQESYEMAGDFSRRANEALDVLPDLEDRETLRDLTTFILERRT
jgi:geranylgeranyl pyrophosphate synthase